MSHGDRPGPESTKSSRGSLHPTSESGVTGTLGTTESSGIGSSSQRTITTKPDKKPLLLERLGISASSKRSRRSWSPSEEERPRKRRQSPLFSMSSGRTLMSRLLNRKERLSSTLTSLKSSLFTPLETSQEALKHLGLDPMNLNHPPVHPLPLPPLAKPKSHPDPSQTTMTTNHPRSSDSWSRTCLGMREQQSLPSPIATPVVRKPVGFFEPTTGTFPKLSSMSKSPPTHQLEFPLHSGNLSSKEKQLISTKSSRHSTMLSLMKREWATWETWKSLLESLNPRNVSPPLPNGLPCGEGRPEQSDLPSLTGVKNSSNTVTTSSRSSLPKSHHHTISSSYMTLPYAMKSWLVNTVSSWTTTGSLVSILPSSCQTELRVTQTKLQERNPRNPTLAMTSPKSATNLTQEHARIPMPTVNTDISVKDATSPATERATVGKKGSDLYGLQPKYLRHNLWEESSTMSPTTTEWSETARPLPRPPPDKVLNPIAFKTITNNADLFQVHTPIKVDVFEALLKNHPNQPFVNSVCAGLCDGFWLWADNLCRDLPVTHDKSHLTPSNEKQANFIRDQCLKERHKGYFSRSFGTDLLPGMYSMPIHAVPKPNSDDLQMVTDHIAGPYSLNSMIDHSQVTSFPLDNMRHLGKILLNTQRTVGNVPITLWKSDIANAYRLLPMSPFWQIKQINTVDGQRYVNRHMAFGSSASAGIFISFNSLVAWIAKNEIGIPYLVDYMDNLSRCNLVGNTCLYDPYKVEMPRDQYRLLMLWDAIGIPHKPHKQVSGSPLTIIGISTDPNLMTLILPDAAKDRLISELKF